MNTGQLHETNSTGPATPGPNSTGPATPGPTGLYTPEPTGLYTPDRIRTYTGRYIDPLNPTPEDIHIEDIAHALSHQCRFGGHTTLFYSVAEHSLDVLSRVNADRLAALLHDASEAYLLDIPSPVKYRLPGYREAEDRLMAVIAEKFGFHWPLSAEVKNADREALVYEWEAFVLRGGVEPISPDRIKYDFLRAFDTLTK